MATRDELVAALMERYAGSNGAERGRILDEFVAVTKCHRQHAARLLRERRRGQPLGPRPGRRIYDGTAREALIPVLWCDLLSRFDLKYSAGGMPHEKLARGIELYGRAIIPLARDMLASQRTPSVERNAA